MLAKYVLKKNAWRGNVLNTTNAKHFTLSATSPGVRDESDREEEKRKSNRSGIL